MKKKEMSLVKRYVITFIGIIIPIICEGFICVKIYNKYFHFDDTIASTVSIVENFNMYSLKCPLCGQDAKLEINGMYDYGSTVTIYCSGDDNLSVSAKVYNYQYPYMGTNDLLKEAINEAEKKWESKYSKLTN